MSQHENDRSAGAESTSGAAEDLPTPPATTHAPPPAEPQLADQASAEPPLAELPDPAEAEAEAEAAAAEAEAEAKAEAQAQSRIPATPPRRGPAEGLDRRTLERRYRLMRNLVVLLVALVVVLVGVSASQFAQLRSGGAAAGTTQGANGAAEGVAGAAGSAQDGSADSASCAAPERRDPNDVMALGDVDAPVVIAEWTDFRCPYCGVFSRDTLPVLLDEYVETGQVRIEVHDVDFIDGEVSARVAVAARAAGEQGRYFEYLFAVYDAMSQDRPAITDAVLVDYARQAGVADIERFTSDLDSPRLREAVRASSEQAKQLGVGSVPFFAETASCRVLQGAQPIEQFRSFLDAAVTAAESGRSKTGE
ncbi:DsbA family protein [Leucobacter chironomi]|uniref:DsbA family protein n=1 Tax=Leucobacter chironomi TaxID=491918 RepID=UPI0004105858|nr:thioredoxin domain-containing protein [Leucobacter chironomi]